MPSVSLVVSPGVKQKTSVKKGDLNPEWDEKLEWELSGKPPSPDEKLELLVKDHDTVGRNRSVELRYSRWEYRVYCVVVSERSDVTFIFEEMLNA